MFYNFISSKVESFNCLVVGGTLVYLNITATANVLLAYMSFCYHKANRIALIF